MSLTERIERKPIPGFDVEEIFSRLQGWKLRPEGVSRDWRSIVRQTSDGKLLVLQMSPAFSTVDFWEINNEDLITFNIHVKNIRSVNIPYNDILSVPYHADIFFRGNVEYHISSNGAIHEVRLPNSGSVESPLIKISYNFPQES